MISCIYRSIPLKLLSSALLIRDPLIIIITPVSPTQSFIEQSKKKNQQKQIPKKLMKLATSFALALAWLGLLPLLLAQKLALHLHD